MEPLKVEAYFFSNNFKHPEPSHIPDLIGLFSKYELMPQYFEETNVNTGVKSKRFCFTNPVTNKSIHFFSDKIVVSVSLNPFDVSGADVKSVFESFLDFVDYSMSACKEHSKDEIKAFRISFVCNLIVAIDGDTGVSRFARQFNESLPWVPGNLTEVKLRTGESLGLNSTDEDINVVVSVNDGVVEKSNGQYTEKQACFLLHLDLNTKPDNRLPRFDVLLASSVWREMSVLCNDKAHEVNAFLSS